MNKLFAIIIAILILPVSAAFANPGQSGSTGLINVPSADTLDAGNVCIGVWANFNDNNHQNKNITPSNNSNTTLIVPVGLTLGIGSFWELYGSYPNLLFDGKEDNSGRGSFDLGTKLRFLGNRDSFFKMAVDVLVQRRVSENNKVDGITDTSSKLIASFSREKLGAHLYGGYLFPGSIPDTPRSNAVVFGAGLEYMVLPRLKVMGEITGSTNTYLNPSDMSMEASAGVQYYLSPHLVMNASAGTGLGKNDPDMRFVFGFSSCQGIGSYVKPIPSTAKKQSDKDRSKEVLKPFKIIPISTLILKASAPQSSPVSKLEVEVEADSEDVLIKPYGQITIAPQQASSNLTSPVIPVEVPLKSRDEEITLQPLQKVLDLEASAIEYTLNRIRGITPLYGVDVKGAQVSISSSGTLPERMSVYRKFRFPDVSFDFDQWTLSNEGRKMLSEVAGQIRKDKKWLFLRVDGYTDNVGSVSYNMDLSLKRAIAVATYLISYEGIDPDKIFIKGLGKSSTLADNDSAEGRRKNRRTEILFLVNKEGH